MPRRLLIWSFASFFAIAPLAGEFACLLGLHPCCLEDHAGGRGRAAGDDVASLGGGEHQDRGAGASDPQPHGHHAHHATERPDQGDDAVGQGQGGHAAVGQGQSERAGRDSVGGASHQDASDGGHASKAADCRTHCDAGGRVAARGRLPRPLAVESQRIPAAVPPSDLTEAVEHVPLDA